jgi:hypothetical protein
MPPLVDLSTFKTRRVCAHLNVNLNKKSNRKERLGTIALFTEMPGRIVGTRHDGHSQRLVSLLQYSTRMESILVSIRKWTSM